MALVIGKKRKDRGAMPCGSVGFSSTGREP